VSALRAQVASSDLLASGHIVLVDTAQGLEVRFDADGTQGPAAARALATLRGVRAGAFVASRDLRQ